MGTQAKQHGDSIAFLLAQIGYHAAEKFAERIATIDLTPPQAGILRAIAAEPGRSQRQLSTELGLLPSRVVAFVDELQERGYVERRRSPDDRRRHALYLTPTGKKAMQALSDLARQHERQLTAGLDAEDRNQLRAMLATIAARQGLTPHVHPGYRRIGRGDAGR